MYTVFSHKEYSILRMFILFNKSDESEWFEIFLLPFKEKAHKENIYIWGLNNI